MKKKVISKNGTQEKNNAREGGGRESENKEEGGGGEIIPLIRREKSGERENIGSRAEWIPKNMVSESIHNRFFIEKNRVFSRFFGQNGQFGIVWNPIGIDSALVGRLGRELE